MKQLVPDFLFQLPRRETEQEELLGNFLDSHKKECTPYFPWLTGEIIDFSGGETTLQIIREYGSMRIHSRDLYDVLGGTERLMRTFDLNGGDDGMLEIQSVSGFITCIRRYSVDILLKNRTNYRDIIQLTGVSSRTIQRSKSFRIRMQYAN